MKSARSRSSAPATAIPDSTLRSRSERRAIRKALTPRAIVEQLAEIALPDEPPDFGETLEDPQGSSLWEALCEQIRKQGVNYHSDRDQVARYERIQTALPDEASRKELVDYDDIRGEEQYIGQQAAYLVGVAVGRRLGGVR